MLAFSPSGEFSEEYSDGVSEPDMSPKLRSASLAAGATGLTPHALAERKPYSGSSATCSGLFGKDSNKIIRRALHEENKDQKTHANERKKRKKRKKRK